MSYDGSNRKEVRAKEKSAAIAESNRIAYVKRIMSDQPGREWMHALLESCSMFHDAMVRDSFSATAHNLGRQSVAKQIFADIVTHCATEYIVMMQEAYVKELADGRRSHNPDRTPDVNPDNPGAVTEYEPGPDDPE